MGIVNSIPNDWKLIIKQSQQHVCPPSNDTIQFNIESTAVDVLKGTSNVLYNEFKRKKQTAPSAQNKIKLKFFQIFLRRGKKSTLFHLPSHRIQN